MRCKEVWEGRRAPTSKVFFIWQFKTIWTARRFTFSSVLFTLSWDIVINNEVKVHSWNKMHPKETWFAGLAVRREYFLMINTSSKSCRISQHVFAAEMCLCESTDWIHAVAAHLALLRLFCKRGLPAPIWLHMFKENSPNKMALLWTTQTKTNPQWWKKYKYFPKRKEPSKMLGWFVFSKLIFVMLFSNFCYESRQRAPRKIFKCILSRNLYFFPIYFSHLNAQYQVKSKYKNKTEKDCILTRGDKCTNQNLI